MRSALGCVVVLGLSSLALAGVPGDVTGDGIADAADLACAIEVAFDANAACAVTQSDYVRTIVVSPVVGDSVASGTRLLDALDGISDASATNPYLLKIEPGVYYFTAGRRLQMKAWVDIEGSGQEVTVLTSAGSSSAISGTVNGADNSALSNLAVENTGSSPYAVGISNVGTSPRISHVRVVAHGAGLDSYGLYNSNASPALAHISVVVYGSSQTNIGMYNSMSSPSTHGLTIRVTGGDGAIGIYNEQCSPTLRDLDVLAADGTSGTVAISNSAAHPVIEGSILKVTGTGNGHAVLNWTGASVDLIRVTAEAEMGGEGVAVYFFGSASPRSLRILNSRLSGGTAAIGGGDPHLTISVGGSQLDGGVDNLAGSIYRCAANFDGDFQSLGTICQ